MGGKKKYECVAGEDTELHFLTARPPLALQVFKAGAFDVCRFWGGGRQRIHESGLGVEEKGDSGVWLVPSAEGWGGVIQSSC